MLFIDWLIYLHFQTQQNSHHDRQMTLSKQNAPAGVRGIFEVPFPSKYPINEWPVHEIDVEYVEEFLVTRTGRSSDTLTKNWGLRDETHSEVTMSDSSNLKREASTKQNWKKNNEPTQVDGIRHSLSLDQNLEAILERFYQTTRQQHIYHMM